MASESSDRAVWIPDSLDNPSPAGIQGIVVNRDNLSETAADSVPVVSLRAVDGTVWSIRGHAEALRTAIDKANPQPGDLAAARYFGARRTKCGRDYDNYKMVVHRPSPT